MEWLNSKMFYISVFSSKETPSLLKLYSQFNFSHQSLYTIGHSISGTSFKAASFYSDIRGITFEAMDSENNMNFLSDSSLRSNKNSVGQIINVFSKSSIFSEYDKSCDIDALLPSRYRFPNVYDTACLTAISCSNTQKYVPFSLQALIQKRNNPIKEFNESIIVSLSAVCRT